MRQIAPAGPVYQAGTLSGNPLVTAAGLATLRRIAADSGLHDRLEAMGATIERRLAAALAEHGVAGCVQRVGSMITLFLGPERVTSWDDAARVDRERFAAFFHAAYVRGVLLPPSPFEAWFLMDAHAATLDTAVDALVAAIGTLT